MPHLDHAAPPEAPRGYDTIDTDYFRRELEQQRRFRLEQLTHLAYDAAATSDEALGEVTSMLMAAARTVLAEIDAALFRLAVGSFGVCQRCNARIPRSRLYVIPMASLCMPCQHAKEAEDQHPVPATLAAKREHTRQGQQASRSPEHHSSAAPDIVDVWGCDSFPASDPPANW